MEQLVFEAIRLGGSERVVPLILAFSRKGEKVQFRCKNRSIAQSGKRSVSIDRARWDVGAGIVGTAAEPEQIHEHYLALFECGGFE